jgi:outer membrane murein-binding lipoprotein Lpp
LSLYQTIGGDIPLNNNAKLSFPSSYPSTAVNNNNCGIAFYWNNSNQFGEIDLLCYGRTAKGGLTISTAGNTTTPFTIAAFLRDYITFFYSPEHPTNTTVGDISATTQYVNDKLTIITAQQSSNNTMITNLSNQVLALQTTVQANNATISRLTSDVTALNAKVDALMRK